MLRSSIAYTASLLARLPSVIARDNAFVARSTKPSLPPPISVAPSQYWEGDDGLWSSFYLQVGTPAQDVRVLISTSSQVSWIVLEGQACLAGDGTCANARGGLYNMNTSSTWEPNGFWQLGNERNLGIFANGLFGNDTIALGIQGSGGPTLSNQILATIGTEQFYLGMFAINPKRTNYTGIAEQGQASYMTSLHEQNLIPSLSFGYTAGAPYRRYSLDAGSLIYIYRVLGLKKVLGSLTLGGYDQSRFTPNNVSFSFAPDNDRDIVVGIQSILATNQDGATHDLLSTGINAYIDTTIPQIWLPLEACKAFEKAFNLTYDAENMIYPVSDRLHKKLMAQNASVTFTLGNSDSGGQTINIILPYDSFDLQAQPPFTANATKYFPLQRAANETQYTLGRTFLQEAYLTVDWDRGNFSVSQCLFEPDMTQEKLVSIRSVNASTTATGQQGGSNTGKIVGIGIGIAVAVLLILGGVAIFFLLRHRKRRRHQDKSSTKGEDESENIRQGFAKAELDTDLDHARYEMGGPDNEPGDRTNDAWVCEMAMRGGLHAELIGDGSRAELTGSGHGASELSSREKLTGPYHEMFDSSVTPVEMPADMPRELPASPLPTLSRSSKSSQSLQSADISPVDRSGSTSPLRQSPGRQHGAERRPAPLRQTSRGPSSPDLSGPIRRQDMRIEEHIKDDIQFGRASVTTEFHRIYPRSFGYAAIITINDVYQFYYEDK
ncbi:MAG: hypothetical protein Q9170_004412 [Blastenia crenularia]